MGVTDLFGCDLDFTRVGMNENYHRRLVCQPLYGNLFDQFSRMAKDKGAV